MRNCFPTMNVDKLSAVFIRLNKKLSDKKHGIWISSDPETYTLQKKGRLLEMNIICFHNPDEENGYLSNWYMSYFKVDGVEFSSMEQYMMYRKAVCFNDRGSADKILETDDVAEIKALGRGVSGYDDHYWNGVRQVIVYEGLVAKFSQNEELKKRLLDTGNDMLAECAVKDRIWGIGLSMTDPDRQDMSKWKGQNLLGYALMMVRNKLIKTE